MLTGKQWLTIDDWSESIVPLSPVICLHDKKLQCSPADVMQVVFVSPRIGGEVLGPESSKHESYESVQFTTCPELLVTLLFVEALEDNEAIFVEKCFQVSRLQIPHKGKAIFEAMEVPRLLKFGCMDAEDYSHLIVDQFEEDNFLRELNKCLLTFLPNMNDFTSVQEYMKTRRARRLTDAAPPTVLRRLSPIGERRTPQARSQILIQGASSSTPTCDSVDTDSELVIQERPSWLSARPVLTPGQGKFIVLGSSGECLPVNRDKSRSVSCDPFASCETSSESSEEFHSARESVEDEDEDDEERYAEKYLSKLYSPDKRYDFARRLREALCNRSMESAMTDSTEDDSNGAGAISVKGPDVFDVDRIRIKRRGSGGFVLKEDSSFDEDVLQELILEAAGDSSKYSFSTDLSSELSDFCAFGNGKEQEVDDGLSEVDKRNKAAVFHFATSILKRGLSESLVGCGDLDRDNIFFQTPCDVNNNDHTAAAVDQESNGGNGCYSNNSRSLSVELVKQKHKLAAKLVSS